MTDQEQGIVKIRGKDYVTVARRVSDFRSENKLDPIETEILELSETRVVMKATISVRGQIVATGHAEEERGETGINSTSALENCETSAVGRALAFYGLAGSEIASASEQADALARQREKELWRSFAEVTAKNEEHHRSLVAIRDYLSEGNWSAAMEAWNEVPREDQMTLWVPPSKGGWLTTEERRLIKLSEREAREHFGEDFA